MLMEEDLVNEDDIEHDLLEGEIAQGGTVSEDHVFGIQEKADNYVFTLGGRGVQIITYANWDVPESEVLKDKE